MQFRQVTTNKYIGENGFQLIQCRNGEFAILKNNTVTKWGTRFQTVRSAENFIRSRNCICTITSDRLPIEASDLDFISEIYGATFKKNGTQLTNDAFTLIIPKDFAESHEVILKVNSRGSLDKLFDDTEELLFELDQLSDTVVASATYRGIELRQILAKSQRRTAREITRNMVRVRSSNMWSYGVEIKENDAKVGDVYIQFKSKQGGPGDIYRYYDVPINVWRKLLSASSKGHAFWQLLRNNFYYSKLTGDKRGKLPNAVN